jgi:hypothetical protein
MTRGSQMSFTDLKVTELKKVAETFAIDASELKTKQEIIALLEEEGISYQMYAKFDNAEKEDIEISEIEKKNRESKIMSKTANQVLVKMERGNHSYQTNGHQFSQQHPFIAMSEAEAQRIFDLEEGFRLATPREAQEYYK